MAYQALARKWRPHNFDELVGQSHVVKSLTNALEHERLHHAYLFTGTRGVGKTTVARILAKAMNCNSLQDFNPCGKCDTCLAIDEGRFLDLIEVDAASRTKVEDTRDLLDNAQYAPNFGRYKVYLIDEVHMLSGHSFNALLKTLEEPPEHVKFLLATTDPHKIPATILSRCLQFNLKRLSPQQISAQLEFILQQEKIDFEVPALKLLARAADGSMRDALSLLDQTIIFSNAHIGYTEVVAMLGTIAQQPVQDILFALAEQNATKLLTVVTQIAELAPDFTAILQQILQSLHRIALYQVNAVAIEAELEQEVIESLAQQLSAEDVQLFYQIALLGQRDLELSPDPQIGFEMVLLRMLSFKPALKPIASGASQTPKPTSTANQSSVEISPSVTLASKPIIEQEPKHISQPAAILDIAEWQSMITDMKLDGLTRQLANNCTLESINDTTCQLLVDAGHQNLCGGVPEAKLQQALQKLTRKNIKLSIKVAQTALITPALELNQAREDKEQAAIAAINNDDTVRALKEQFGARIMPGTIEPL